MALRIRFFFHFLRSKLQLNIETKGFKSTVEPEGRNEL